jgi:hypothetical protein
MLDIKHIFNLTRLGKDVKCLSATINNDKNGVGVALGTPLVVSKEHFESDKSKITRVVFPFPFRSGYEPGRSPSMDKSHLTVISGECFLNNSKIKVIPRFEINKLDSLLEYVKDNGAMTFNITSQESTKKTAKNVCKFLDKLYKMCDMYKYNSVFYCDYPTGSRICNMKDTLYTARFLDLHNCVPIFNHKRVDGVGVIFNMSSISSTKATGSLATNICITLVLSNYKDNIFTTDGIQVNEIKPLRSSVINKVKNIVMAGAGVKDKFEVKEDSEKVDIGEFGDKISEGWIDISVSNNDDINTGDYIITTSSYDTNTGATYHYTSS